ncbi:hypothetical protein ACFVXC_19320 [Streptomyces sp. NPDC058257]|uniref:hypothetical protein n=1 Tax=Streptomyces sp. NPDC058257 TaxID=3346409 RepID=UPI0036E5644E
MDGNFMMAGAPSAPAPTEGSTVGFSLSAPLPTGTAIALIPLAAATLPALFRRSPRIRWSR